MQTLAALMLGMGRALDLFGMLGPERDVPTSDAQSIERDRWALRRDWRAVEVDVRRAWRACEREA